MKALTLFFIFSFSISTQAVPQKLRTLRDQSRNVMNKSRCAKCHSPSLEPQETALKVYNLDHLNWSSTMTDSQLENLKFALEGETVEEIREMHADPEKTKLSEKEKSVIAEFVNQELAFRKRNPNHRFKETFQQANPGISNILKASGAEADESCIL